VSQADRSSHTSDRRDKMFRRLGVESLSVSHPDHERRRGRAQRTHLEPGTREALEALLDQCDAPAGLHGGDEAGGAVSCSSATWGARLTLANNPTSHAWYSGREMGG
jgi:hypothetical protein